MSKETLDTFLEKKVFIKIIDDKVQVGVLKKSNNDYYLESRFVKTVINPDQIARITEEKK